MNRIIAIGCMGLLSLTGGRADVLAFRQTGQLRGEVQAISAAGVVTLQSGATASPLHLKLDQLTSVHFPTNVPPAWSGGAMVTLRNGDYFPANTLSWSEDVLQAATPWGAVLPIPRSQLEYLKWGTTQNAELYRGPQQNDWQLGENWKIDAGLVAYGWGAASHQFATLPARWILAFDLTWDGTVNFQVVMGSESALPDESSTAYVLMFHGGGLELKKRIRGQARLMNLAPLSDFTPDFFRGKVRFELRVDQQQRLLQLSANGVLLRRCVIDPDDSGPVPSGSWLSLMTNAGQEDRHAVKNLQLLSWDRRFEEAQREKRKAGERDWLFDVDSNRISGTWKSMRAGAGDQWIEWENPQQPQLLQIPCERAAMVVFAGKTRVTEKGVFSMNLHHEGRLQVNGLVLENRKFTVKHPLLGELTLPQELVQSIERQEKELKQDR